MGTISHPRQPAPDPKPGCRHQQPGHSRGGTECDLPDNWGRSGLQPPRTHALDSSRRKQVPGPHVLGMTLEALPIITTRISMHWPTRARMQAEAGSGQGVRRCVRPDSLNRTPGPAEALGARYAYNFLGMRGEVFSGPRACFCSVFPRRWDIPVPSAKIRPSSLSHVRLLGSLIIIDITQSTRDLLPGPRRLFIVHIYESV